MEYILPSNSKIAIQISFGVFFLDWLYTPQFPLLFFKYCLTLNI